MNTPPEPYVSALLNTSEAAKRLHIPAGTLRYWRSAGIGPAYVKMGRTVLYAESDLISYVQSHTIQPSVRATAILKEANRVSR